MDETLDKTCLPEDDKACSSRDESTLSGRCFFSILFSSLCIERFPHQQTQLAMVGSFLIEDSSFSYGDGARNILLLVFIWVVVDPLHSFPQMKTKVGPVPVGLRLLRLLGMNAILLSWMVVMMTRNGKDILVVASVLPLKTRSAFSAVVVTVGALGMLLTGHPVRSLSLLTQGRPLQLV